MYSINMEGKSIMNAQGRVYKLLGVDGNFYYNTIPGTLGGNSKLKIYGRLDCPSALRYLNKGYPLIRVFFADEEAAILAGYRPCGHCMREKYKIWKAGGVIGSPEYLWHIGPET